MTQTSATRTCKPTTARKNGESEGITIPAMIVSLSAMRSFPHRPLSAAQPVSILTSMLPIGKQGGLALPHARIRPVSFSLLHRLDEFSQVAQSAPFIPHSAQRRGQLWGKQ